MSSMTSSATSCQKKVTVESPAADFKRTHPQQLKTFQTKRNSRRHRKRVSTSLIVSQSPDRMFVNTWQHNFRINRLRLFLPRQNIFRPLKYSTLTWLDVTIENFSSDSMKINEWNKGWCNPRDEINQNEISSRNKGIKSGSTVTLRHTFN